MDDAHRPAGWSELTSRVLRWAAWYPERAVPVDRWEAELHRHGLGLHEAARRFLGEFGGLGTDDWTPGPVVPRTPFRFDPAAAGADRERFARFRAAAGVELSPLGVADAGAALLGMAPDGTVYLGAEQAERFARTGHEAVEKLVAGPRTGAAQDPVRGGSAPAAPAGSAAPAAPDLAGLVPDGARWSAQTDRVLREAGWYPGREVATDDWERALHEADEGFVVHEAARRFLGEFGGLDVQVDGPGRTMSRSPFRLDPLVARWDFEIIDVQSEEMGARLCPVGDTDRGNAYLTMAPDGAVYLGMDYPRKLAASGDQALTKLVEGIA